MRQVLAARSPAKRHRGSWAQILREGGNRRRRNRHFLCRLGRRTVDEGLGGGGYMLVYLAKEDQVRIVDFGMIAPTALDLSDYPLEPEGAVISFNGCRP